MEVRGRNVEKWIEGVQSLLKQCGEHEESIEENLQKIRTSLKEISRCRQMAQTRLIEIQTFEKPHDN